MNLEPKNPKVMDQIPMLKILTLAKIKGKFLGIPRIQKNILHPLTFMVGLTMNLMNRPYNGCERREYHSTCSMKI